MIGDRWQHNSSGGMVIEETTSGDSPHQLISNPTNIHGYPVGMLGKWSPNESKYWIYLGNFTKVSNVKKLYEKLCC